MRPSRREVLARAGGASLALAFMPAVARADLLPPDTGEQKTEALADRVIDALERAYGRHRGLRRNHTKGVGARGVFVGNPEASVYSRSALFSGATIDVVARFSLAGGDPEASDAERSPRGLGLEFRMPDGGLHHMTLLHTPMFFATTPKTFLDKFVALAVDPKTGTHDPAKLTAFQASHPDIASQVKFLAANNPPASYASCSYYGIHTFKCVDARNAMTLVKLRFAPQDGDEALTDAELATAPRDFLEKALIERLAKGPARWDLILTIGEPDDEQLDPTVLWPAGRKEVTAGTLTLTSAAPAAVAGSNKINFDPLVMADGIEPTDDPILLFRSASYATSFTRRLRDV